MVEIVPSLCFYLLDVVHESELLLHVRCAITVHLLVKLQLGLVTEGASDSVCLDYMMSIKVIVMLELCEDELASYALHPTHIDCALPIRASFI